jgi:hypothetical protein
MVVGVNDGSIYYKLNSPPWNGSLSDWSIFQSGGGGDFTGGTISGDTIFTQGVTATTLNVNGVSITGDTYTTGGTYSSGILNFNYNTGGGYQISGLDTTNTYITGFTYDNINTFNINDNSGNTFSSSINVLSATTISGGTFYGDGSNLTNTPDKYITNLSFNNSNYDLTVTRSDSWSDTVSLSILSSDMTITGGTYNPGTGVATFTNNSGGTFNVSGFLVGYTDHYVTGYTYDGSNTFNIFDNSGNTFSASINEVSGLTVNGSLSSDIISASTYYNLPVVSDTNFANTDLTFSGFREHNLNGYGMYLTTDGGGYNEAFFTLDTVSTSFGLLTPNGSNIIYQTAAPLTPGIIENIGASAIRTHTLTESTFFINTSRNFIIRQESTPTQPTFLIDGSSNNVGIGISSPSSKLVVSGQTTLVQPQSSNYLVFSSSTLANSGQTMYIRQTASNQYVFGSTGIGNFMRVGPTNVVNFEGQTIQSLLRGAQFGSSLSNPVQIPYAINISTLPSQSTGTTSNVDAIRINPSITTTSTYTGTYRGIYYNPTVSITTGTTHLAIETVRGDVIFGSTSGNVGIGTTNPTTRLHVAGNSLMSASTQNVLTVIGSGNTSSPPIFSVQGSNGELFSVNDSLIGSLFSVNDISGLPIFEVFSDNTILMGSYLSPSLNTTVRVLPSVGTTNVYSLPLSAYTGAWFEYTVKSGTGARSGQIMSIFSGTTVNITETTTTSIGVTTPITFNMISDGTNATLRVSVISGTWEVRVIIRSI